jgi:hypothetical protein
MYPGGDVICIIQMFTFFRIWHIFYSGPAVFRSTILTVNIYRTVQLFGAVWSLKCYVSPIIIIDNEGSRFLTSLYFYSYTRRHIGYVKSFTVVVTIAIKSIFPKVSLILYKIFTKQATQFYGILICSSLILTIIPIKLSDNCVLLLCILGSELPVRSTKYAKILQQSFQHLYNDTEIQIAGMCGIKKVRY